MSVPTADTAFACRGPQFNALLTWSWTPSDESIATGQAQDVEWIAPHLKALSDIYTDAEGLIPDDENIGYANYNGEQLAFRPGRWLTSSPPRGFRATS
jgi:hypothetical protein